MPMMDYAVNYDYISKKLCENREKPQLLCKGKCYLKKELSKTSEQSSKNDSRISTSGFIDTFIIDENFIFFTIINYNSEKSNSISDINFSYRFNLFSDIFHPPLI